MNEYNKDFSNFFDEIKGRTNNIDIFTNFFQDKFPMVIKNFAKILE
jgi:hypothetical protein